MVTNQEHDVTSYIEYALARRETTAEMQLCLQKPVHAAHRRSCNMRRGYSVLQPRADLASQTS